MWWTCMELQALRREARWWRRLRISWRMMILGSRIRMGSWMDHTTVCACVVQTVADTWLVGFHAHNYRWAKSYFNWNHRLLPWHWQNTHLSPILHETRHIRLFRIDQSDRVSHLVWHSGEPFKKKEKKGGSGEEKPYQSFFSSIQYVRFVGLIKVKLTKINERRITKSQHIVRN